MNQPTTGLEHLPARKGRAARLAEGETITVINTHGHQVVDVWAFSNADLGEFLSMEHTRAAIDRIVPREGDVLVTNQRRPILTVVEDTSPGVHDTLIAPCDIYRYRGLGVSGFHDSCANNLVEALAAIGLAAPQVPASWNLWMNIPVAPDGSIQWLPPVSRPGDRLTLKAEMDCVFIMSACPQDIVAINANNPVEAHYSIDRAA